MSYNTKVVIYCGSSATDDTIRITEALSEMADSHGRVASFEHITEFFHPNTSTAHGEVIVGSVNYLDEDILFDVLRGAASNPAWSTDYAPLVVILRGDDESNVPRTLALDADGVWTTLTSAGLPATSTPPTI